MNQKDSNHEIELIQCSALLHTGKLISSVRIEKNGIYHEEHEGHEKYNSESLLDWVNARIKNSTTQSQRFSEEFILQPS